MSGKGNFPSTQKQVSLFQRLHSDLFSFCSIFIVFCLTCFSFLSLSCSASPWFSPACSLWGNPWQIKLRRTYQRQITSCALRKALLHQSARVLRRASSLQCLTCELDMHPTEEEVEKWYPHYSKWIKNISLTNTPDYILLYATHVPVVMAAIYTIVSESTTFIFSPSFKWLNIKITSTLERKTHHAEA